MKVAGVEVEVPCCRSTWLLGGFVVRCCTQSCNWFAERAVAAGWGLNNRISIAIALPITLEQCFAY